MVCKKTFPFTKLLNKSVVCPQFRMMDLLKYIPELEAESLK